MLFASREIQITEQKLHLTLFAPPKNELALFGFFRSLCRTILLVSVHGNDGVCKTLRFPCVHIDEPFSLLLEDYSSSVER